MAKRIVVGPVAEVNIEPGTVGRFQVDGITIALTKTQGQYFAFPIECPHDGCDFSEYGEVEDYELTCTCHFSCYDLRSGERTFGPMTEALELYTVTVEEGQVVVTIPDDI